MIADRILQAQNTPITKHHPATNQISPQRRITPEIRVPDLRPPPSSCPDDDFEDWAVDIHEWLGLAAIESPRIRRDDAIDPFLSRYRVLGELGRDHTLVTLTWTGFIPALWVRQLFVYMLK